MTNKIYTDQYKISVASAIEKSKSAAGIDHAGLRGRIREILAEDLIRPILPPGCDIGNGKIIDTRDNSSSECDVVVYHRSILPPLLFNQSTGFFPIEACLYAIEVKSKLTSQEIDSTIKKFKRLSMLYALRPDTRPIPTVFAFDTDLLGSTKSELERYLERDPGGMKEPFVRVICVVGSGYWYFLPSAPDRFEWRYFPPRDDHQEVIDFIGGVANTVSKEWVKRLQAPFGFYIVEEGRMATVAKSSPSGNDEA